MGLFDTIRFEFEIPGRGALHEWQTKSLECALEEYLVKKDYRIYKEEWDIEWIADDSRALFKGYTRKIPNTYRLIPLTDYHGDIIFYDVCSSCEYTARFSYGKMDNITFKTREWLSDEQKLLHQCAAIREQNSCPRGEEWQERCREAGVPPHIVYQVKQRKQV